MDHLYSAHIRTLEQSYGEILGRTGFDAVVIHSGTAKKKIVYDDQYFAVRPTPAFQHWLPLGEPGCHLVIEAGKKPRLYWPIVRDFWERPAPPESTVFLDVLDVVRGSDVAVPQGRVAFVGEDESVGEKLGIASLNPADLTGLLDALRTLKTPYEIACLAEANRRAALGHLALKNAFFSGSHSELDLHLLYLKTTHQDDPETPYKNIVALGKNAAILHHVSYGKNEDHAESLLVDAGAQCRGYGSDVTRTWVKGKNTFAGLVAAMEGMQQRLCELVALGKPYEELHDESHRQVSVILAESGVVKASADEIDGKGISRVFYPHGLGHSLGLQTHDVGCGLTKPRSENPFLRNTSKIEEHQTFTIEPGLYFIDALLAELRDKPEGKAVDWKLVDALTPFGGIRVEDDLEVKTGGFRNLTREVLP